MNKIQIAVLKVGEPLSFVEIEPDLDAMQKIVGGLIEMVSIAEGLDMVCNEEGKLNGLEINFRFGNMPIVGDVFFTRHDDGRGAVSLTEADIGLISTLCRQIRAGVRRAAV